MTKLKIFIVGLFAVFVNINSSNAQWTTSGNNIWNSNIGCNVGIGTTNPEKKFQINASNTDAGLRLHTLTTENNTNTPYLLLTGGYKTNNGVAIRGVSDYSYGRKALAFYSGWDGNTDDPQITDLHEGMRIASSGNVGIGTTNPEKKFQINASNTDAGLRLHTQIAENNTNTPYLLLTGGYKTNNGVAIRGVSDQSYGRKALVFYSGWTGNTDDPQITDLHEGMRIASSGNVGIGTTSPEKSLQINASNTDAGLRLHTQTAENNTNTPYLLLTGGYKTNNGVAIRGVSDQTYGRKALVFYSGWDGDTDDPQITDLHEGMRISSNGNVKI